MSVLPPVPAAPAQPSARASRRSPLRSIARFALGLVVAAWSLLLIAWLSLHWFILPHIQQWRAPIEARAGEALGVGVRIGTIEVRSSGWIPGLELRDVVLFDSSGREALRLQRVVASISPRSLIAFDLRFDQLLIEGPMVEVRRDPAGRILVAGLDFGGTRGAADDGAALDWFFKQGEFVIRGGALRWIDEQRQAAPLTLTDVQLVVRNGLREHDIRLDATPPVDWGERFTVQGRFHQPFLGRTGDWRRWSGAIYVALPQADVRELRQHVTLPFELSAGNGALRAWFDVADGEPRAATVDLALREVSLRLAPDVEPLTVEQLEGRFEGRRDADGIALALQRFSFRTADGVLWPQGDLALTLRQREGEDATGGSFKAQHLDVGVMAQIATRVPIGAVRNFLADVAPQGVARDILASWEGPLESPRQYRVQGALGGLSLAARASDEPHGVGRPGLRNATLQLAATEAGGDARVTMNGGAIDLPGVFADPLVPLDQLAAHLLWKIEPAPTPAGASRLTVQLKDTRFANADARGELAATWTSGDVADSAHGGRFPGRLELDGKLASGQAVRIARYLPLGIPEGPRHYVEGAVRGGAVKNVTFRVKGHLRDFPFHNARGGKDGEFRIAGQAEDATFAFVPGSPQWPALTRVAGELVIDRSTLEFRNARAQLGGVEWTRVQGRIPDLGERPVLSLDGAARGPLAEMVNVVNATPIGGWLGKSLATASATGPVELKLALAIPLEAVSTTAVTGSLALAGNDVRISADTPLLAGAKGRIDFTQKDFAVVAATARVLGGDASFDGGTQTDDSIRFSGQGTASADGLRRAAELGPVARVATALAGQANYRFTLGFVHGRSQLLVTSNLAGMAIDLPVPLSKLATTALELRYQTTLLEDVAGSPRENLRLDLGNVLQAHYLREQGADGTRVVNGGIGVLAPPPTPGSGVAANLNVQRVDVDAWEAAYQRMFPPVPASAAPAGATGSGGTGPSEGYAPETVALRAQELRSGGHLVTGAVIGATEEASGLWRASVNADQLDGYVEYRPARRRGSAAAAAAAAGRIYARLSRLSLPKSDDVVQVESLLDVQPTSVPALDIVVDDFELRGKRFGRVEIEAANRISREPGREVTREWRLSKLNISMPEARLTATGAWAPSGPAARRRATLDFTLAVADSGALLERLGAGKAIRGGKGELSGQVSWAGSPLSIDYPSMSGQVNVAVDSGQFLKAEPGAARLLSVLSLQSLPRRLAFDFRDLFEQGFAFDSITGDVGIAEGTARTNNLRMRGPAAVVLMEGSADIARETEDLRVVVVPEINAGTASLAYAIINPAVGIGTFLAQYFLRKPLIEAGTREFRVTGPWADPKVERVERSRSRNVSAADTPVPAASVPNQ